MFTNETTSFILRCVRKTIWMLLVLWGITLVSFFVIHLAPGTPTDMQTTLNPLAGEAARARLEALYGIDRPLYIQYFDWLSRIVQLDFGNSMSSDARPVIEKIAERLPLTIGINVISLLLTLLIAVPTTAGTGSEVTLAAVITDDETHYKYPINDFVLIPRFAVHDPEFTRGLPASITGQTGMDALTHAVEAFIGRSTTSYTRKMARQAVQLIHDNLLEAYEHGGNMRARRNMLSAAYKAGAAFTRSYVGYVHAIAHSLGGRYGIPHGLANAIILPHMLRAYGDAAAPKLADLARMAGIAPANAQDSLAAEAFIDWVDRMNETLGIPRYVSGIRRSDIPEMATHADAEANPLYPVPLLMDRLELEHMYEVVAGGMFEDEN